MRVRDWECSCGLKFAAEVVEPSVGEIGWFGERIVWCPSCNKKPYVGGPHREMDQHVLCSRGGCKYETIRRTGHDV